MRTWASQTSFGIDRRPLPGGGFTLVELIVSMGLASFILVAVLTTFLMLGKVTRSIQNYTEIEAGARKSIETMSREIRLAFVVTNYSATSFTVSIPDSTGTTPDTTVAAGANNLYNQSAAYGAYQVTYAYDATNNQITRTGPPVYNPAGTSTTSTLVRNVELIAGNNVFNYYHRYATASHSSTGYVNGYENNLATSATDINQIEVKFLLKETTQTVADATNKVLSARFILRNKL